MNKISIVVTVFVSVVARFIGAQQFEALIAPITQVGNSSSPFTITINDDEKLVIDIESPLSWHRCPREFPRVSCLAPVCTPTQSNKSSYCHLNIPRIPPKLPCTCFTLPSNPFLKKCASSQLTYVDVSIDSINGHNSLTRVNYDTIFVSCAPKSLFMTLPSASSGVASLSKGPLSLVSQFSRSNLPTKFGLCLGNRGFAFFGEEPHNALPQSISYTPFINHPNDTVGYYIGVKGISVNSHSINFDTLSFDQGVKLSTTTPYTTLKSPIFKALVKKFSMSTKNIPRGPKIAPFDYCLDTTKSRYNSRVGLRVPRIDLELSNGANWTIYETNSMTRVIGNISCLAFVDGGEKAKHAMVIGSYQMQHNFLLFDLVNFRLGFSSSLLFFNNSCNRFNFTLVGY